MNSNILQQPPSVSCPLLVIHADLWQEEDNFAKEEMLVENLSQLNMVHWLKLKRAGHLDYTDFPSLSPLFTSLMKRTSPLHDPKDTLETLEEVLLNFMKSPITPIHLSPSSSSRIEILSETADN